MRNKKVENMLRVCGGIKRGVIKLHSTVTCLCPITSNIGPVILSAAKNLPSWSQGFFAALRMTGSIGLVKIHQGLPKRITPPFVPASSW